jgi:hypothetical protein
MVDVLREFHVSQSGYETMLKPGRSRVRDPMRFYLILLAVLVPGIYSAFNRNEYQKKNISGE